MEVIERIGNKKEATAIRHKWLTTSITEVATLKARIGWQGLTTSEYLDDGDYFLVTGTDFFDGKVRWETCHFVEKERYVQDKNIQIQNGDILITKDGTIGKVAFVNNVPRPATLNSGVFVVRIKDEVTNDPQYLYYVFESKYFRKFLSELVAGSTINHLYQKDFVSFRFPLPPTKAEQTAIASALSDADSLITSLEKLITKKRNIKQGVMQKLLEPKKGWDMKRLDEVGVVIRGASPRPQGDKRFYGGNVPRLMVEDVTRDGKYVTPIVDFLTEAGAKLSRPCKKGTLTIVCSGTVGIPSILAVDACIHDGFLAVINIKKGFSTDFLYHHLSMLRNQLNSTATHGGIFTNLTTASIKEFELAFPDCETQEKIATLLSDMDEEINVLEKKLEKQRLLKQGMIQNLLTGKIRLM